MVMSAAAILTDWIRCEVDQRPPPHLDESSSENTIITVTDTVTCQSHLSVRGTVPS